MNDYTYTAKHVETGELIKAKVKAESPEAAAKLLVKQKLFPLDITTQDDSGILGRLGLGKRVRYKERVLFTRQLATMINAGLPLARALRTVQEQIKNPFFHDIISNVLASVEGGMTLSAAFAQHPKVFNAIYVAMVQAGETSGTLDKTLMRLAAQQEKDAAIISKIRSAMVYPAIVLVVIIAVLTLMLATIVPQVAKLYEDLNKSLPFLTKLLLFVSKFITDFWWLTFLILVAAVFGVRAALKNEKVQLWLDRFKIKAPVLGVIVHKMYMARLCRTLSSLLASGIPVLQALDTTKGALTNRLVRADIDHVIERVRGGVALSTSLGEGKHIMSLVPQMAKIGEESGSIDDMLGRAATYYEDEVDEAVKNLSTTLEPAMMIILGVLVALVLGAVLYPIYSLVGGGLGNLK